MKPRRLYEKIEGYCDYENCQKKLYNNYKGRILRNSAVHNGQKIVVCQNCKYCYLRNNTLARRRIIFDISRKQQQKLKQQRRKLLLQLPPEQVLQIIRQQEANT